MPQCIKYGLAHKDYFSINVTRLIAGICVCFRLTTQKKRHNMRVIG
nr:MAG TPA: hypothetical protein [Caudoviricetes sp.]